MKITRMYWNKVLNTFKISITTPNGVIGIPITEREFDTLLASMSNFTMQEIKDNYFEFGELEDIKACFSLN